MHKFCVPLVYSTCRLIRLIEPAWPRQKEHPPSDHRVRPGQGGRPVGGAHLIIACYSTVVCLGGQDHIELRLVRPTLAFVPGTERDRQRVVITQVHFSPVTAKHKQDSQPEITHNISLQLTFQKLSIWGKKKFLHKLSPPPPKTLVKCTSSLNLTTSTTW